MSVKETTVDSKVETLDINLDEIFDAAPSGSDITLPNETKSKPSILSGLSEKPDFSFSNPEDDGVDDLSKKTEGESAATTDETVDELVEDKNKS